MILSFDADKAYDKIQQAFMIKVVERLGIKGTYINIIITIYNKQNKIYSQHQIRCEKLKGFLLKSGQEKAVHSLHIYSI